MKNLLRQLTQIVAPSGYEHQIREAISDLVAPYADDITTDTLGNLIVRKGAKGRENASCWPRTWTKSA